MPAPTKPSQRQLDLAKAVEQLSRRQGYPPTLAELAVALGVNTPRAHAIAHEARAAGLITFTDGRARTIRTTQHGRKDRGRA